MLSAYLINKVKSMSVEDAIGLVKDAFKECNPNEGFRKQLMDYYLKIHPELTEKKEENVKINETNTDEKKEETKKEPEKVPTAEFLCKKCRHILFNDLSIMKHRRPKNPGANKRYGQFKKAAVFQSKRYYLVRIKLSLEIALLLKIVLVYLLKSSLGWPLKLKYN